MRARKLLDKLFEAAAPTIAPSKPTTRPTTRPDRKDAPTKPGRPSPWRRKEIRPGEEPRPKAAYGLDTTYSEAKEFLKLNGFEEFVE